MVEEEEMVEEEVEVGEKVELGVEEEVVEEEEVEEVEEVEVEEQAPALRPPLVPLQPTDIAVGAVLWGAPLARGTAPLMEARICTRCSVN